MTFFFISLYTGVRYDLMDTLYFYMIHHACIQLHRVVSFFCHCAFLSFCVMFRFLESYIIVQT